MKNTRIHERLQLDEIGDTPKGASRIIGMLAKREAGRRAGMRNLDDVERSQGYDRAEKIAGKTAADHNRASDQISKVGSYMQGRLTQDEPPDSPKAGKAAIKSFRDTKKKIKADMGRTPKRKEPVSKSMDKFVGRTQAVSRKN